MVRRRSTVRFRKGTPQVRRLFRSWNRRPYFGYSSGGRGLVFAHLKIAGQKRLGAGLSGPDEQSGPPWGQDRCNGPRHREWAHGTRSTIEPPEFLTERDSAGGNLLDRGLGRMVGRILLPRAAGASRPCSDRASWATWITATTVLCAERDYPSGAPAHIADSARVTSPCDEWTLSVQIALFWVRADVVSGGCTPPGARGRHRSTVGAGCGLHGIGRSFWFVRTGWCCISRPALAAPRASLRRRSRPVSAACGWWVCHRGRGGRGRPAAMAMWARPCRRPSARGHPGLVVLGG